jgi:hypothetical protein
MDKRKLEISDDLKIHLSKMREALAGVSFEYDDIVIPKEGCGAQCEITCAHYCWSNCYDTCRKGCKDFFAIACELKMIFDPQD